MKYYCTLLIHYVGLTGLLLLFIIASTISYTSSGGGSVGVKIVEQQAPSTGGMQSGLYSSSPVSYSSGAMPSATAPHSGKPQAMQPLPITHQGQLRNKVNISLLHINKSLYNLLKYNPS